MTELIILCIFALIAGFVDAAVGGGGLIQLPAALILMPGVSVPTVLGTNKFASFFGTSFAVQRYARHVKMDWSHRSAYFSRGLCLRVPRLTRGDPARTGRAPAACAWMLVVVAIYVFLVEDLGLCPSAQTWPTQSAVAGVVIGSVLGFYDGFFGPGWVVSSLRVCRALRFRFPLRFRFSQGGQLVDQSRLADLLHLEREHSLRDRARHGRLQHYRRDHWNENGNRERQSVRPVFFLLVVAALIAKLTQTLFCP